MRLNSVSKSINILVLDVSRSVRGCCWLMNYCFAVLGSQTFAVEQGQFQVLLSAVTVIRPEMASITVALSNPLVKSWNHQALSNPSGTLCLIKINAVDAGIKILLREYQKFGRLLSEWKNQCPQFGLCKLVKHYWKRKSADTNKCNKTMRSSHNPKQVIFRLISWLSVQSFQDCQNSWGQPSISQWQWRHMVQFASVPKEFSQYFPFQFSDQFSQMFPGELHPWE